MNSVALRGTVISVRGAVVDVSFDAENLPPINTAMIVEWDRPEPLILEVHSHVDPTTVRSIALRAPVVGAAGDPRDRAAGRNHSRNH
jgi:F-type H+-transporting ATPase subunit beta